ncbi:uncharacterized protein LOC141852639 isoform X2 [Brevipalpus obovatus]|uniref:uncharacterized protein LOC141852639 isoform X2 n=1 Tax=Brevipalpus obovatus TaxID=246614 RepID=UPI003D9DC0FA
MFWSPIWNIFVNGIIVIVLLLNRVTDSAISTPDDQMLTKLDCQKGHSRNFKYQSETKLWGPLEEKIEVSAHVDISCMGRDRDSNALKYMVQLYDVKPALLRNGEVMEKGRIIKRPKRGVGSWLEESWQKVKIFFIRLFRSQLEKGLDENLEVEFGRAGCVPPVVVKEKHIRQRRSASIDDKWFDETISLPFEFLQTPGGPIIEIRMNKRENNEAVKNFKKHIVDTFATQLNGKKQDSLEESPIGEHFTHYAVSDKENSVDDAIKVAGIPLVNFVKKNNKNPRKGKKMHIIRDVGRDDVLNVNSGSVLVHNMDKVNITIRQVQQIADGELTECAGQLSLDLITDNNELVDPRAVFKKMKSGHYGHRMYRSVDRPLSADLATFMKVRTVYTMNSSPIRRRRDTDEQKRFERLQRLEDDLVSETLVASSLPGAEERRKLSELQDVINRLTQLGGRIDLKNFIDGRNSPAYQAMKEALLIESKLQLSQKGERTISNGVRDSLNREVIENLCGQGSNFSISKCHGLLVIGLIAESPDTIDILLEHIKDKKSEVHAILLQHAHPDEKLMVKLLDHLENSSQNYKDTKGVHLITLSALAYRSKSPKIKRKIARILNQELSSASCDQLSTIDLLEAAGNLDGRDYLPSVIGLTKKCSSSQQIVIASIHALRHLINEPTVQEYYTSLMINQAIDCTTKREVLLTLREIENQRKSSTSTSNNVNVLFPQIVTFGQRIMTTQDPQYTCLLDEMMGFLKGETRQAQESISTTINRRRRRQSDSSFWDESNCVDFSGKEKSKDAVPTVSDKKPEASRRSAESIGYIQRRKCVASKTFGPRQLQATLKADVMNDILEEGNNPDYKMTANFGFSSHVLGKDVDIGRMFLFQRRNASRAYVTLFGQTLLDSKSESCETKPFEPYRYSAYVPLYDFTVWVVKVGLGIRFNGEMAFDHYNRACDSKAGKDSPDHIQVTPEASMRVSGEASGTVLVIKGGVDIGGDFHYRSSLRFQPDPQFCMTAHNTHRPMNVSVQPWFQYWDTNCEEWGMRSVFGAETLSWEIVGRESSPWFENQCMATKIN